MEPTPVPSFTARILLTAFFLSSWNLPVTAQLTVESVPPNVVEGRNVLLLVHTGIDNVKNYQWYKGQGAIASQLIATYQPEAHTNTTGPAYSHRETIHPNGSLLLEKVTLADTGFYTLQAIDAGFGTHLASVQFHVYPQLPKPSITSNNSRPVEGEDSVALTCEPDSPNASYLWRVSGQSLPDDGRLQLSNNNRTLTLLSVLRNDTGPYECRVWNPASENTSDLFTLDILYGPETPTILPPESHFLTGTNLSLSCHAASNPPAQYSWLINGRPQPSSPELFIPNITANNSGSYTCLANNSATGLNRTAVKIITVLGEVSKPRIQVSNTTVMEQASVVFHCLSNDNTTNSTRWLFKGQSLKLTDRMKLTDNNNTLTIEPVQRDDGGTYQCEVSNPVSFQSSDALQLTVIANPAQGDSQLSPGAIAGIVVGVVAGVALIAALAYFLCSRKSRASNPPDLTEHKPSATNHSQKPSDKAPNQVYEVAYTSVDFRAQKPDKETSASTAATETIYSEVKK